MNINNLQEGLIQLSVLVTIISLIWSLLLPLFDLNNELINAVLLFVFGLGGIGLYLPIGLKIKEAMYKIKWLK